MTFKKHLKLNKFMKERGRSRVLPLSSYPEQPHYNEFRGGDFAQFCTSFNLYKAYEFCRKGV